jgi:hypothetical protein
MVECKVMIISLMFFFYKCWRLRRTIFLKSEWALLD